MEEQSRYEYTLRDYNSTLLPLTYNSNPTKSKVVYAAFSLFYDYSHFQQTLGKKVIHYNDNNFNMIPLYRFIML